MKRFVIYILNKDAHRWIEVSTVRARTAGGAIAQIAVDSRFFPDMVAIKAIEQ